VNCFPFNYAIGRLKQLYADVRCSSGFNHRIETSLIKRSVESGFESIEKSFIPPFFLTLKQRRLIELLFRYAAHHAIAYKLITKEEEIALAAELTNYLSDKKNMISLPGILQFKATKM